MTDLRDKLGKSIALHINDDMVDIVVSAIISQHSEWILGAGKQGIDNFVTELFVPEDTSSAHYLLTRPYDEQSSLMLETSELSRISPEFGRQPFVTLIGKIQNLDELGSELRNEYNSAENQKGIERLLLDGDTEHGVFIAESSYDIAKGWEDILERHGAVKILDKDSEKRVRYLYKSMGKEFHEYEVAQINRAYRSLLDKGDQFINDPGFSNAYMLAMLTNRLSHNRIFTFLTKFGRNRDRIKKAERIEMLERETARYCVSHGVSPSVALDRPEHMARILKKCYGSVAEYRQIREKEFNNSLDRFSNLGKLGNNLMTLMKEYRDIELALIDSYETAQR